MKRAYQRWHFAEYPAAQHDCLCRASCSVVLSSLVISHLLGYHCYRQPFLTLSAFPSISKGALCCGLKQPVTFMTVFNSRFLHSMPLFLRTCLGEIRRKLLVSILSPILRTVLFRSVLALVTSLFLHGASQYQFIDEVSDAGVPFHFGAAHC